MEKFSRRLSINRPGSMHIQSKIWHQQTKKQSWTYLGHVMRRHHQTEQSLAAGSHQSSLCLCQCLWFQSQFHCRSGQYQCPFLSLSYQCRYQCPLQSLSYQCRCRCRCLYQWYLSNNFAVRHANVIELGATSTMNGGFQQSCTEQKICNLCAKQTKHDCAQICLDNHENFTYMFRPS